MIIIRRFLHNSKNPLISTEECQENDHLQIALFAAQDCFAAGDQQAIGALTVPAHARHQLPA